MRAKQPFQPDVSARFAGAQGALDPVGPLGAVMPGALNLMDL